MAAPDDMFMRLMVLNGEAFAAGSYEAAYHALAAALHRGMDLKAIALLASVEHAASDQMAYIDRHTPEHPLSSASARRRGHGSIYGMLARQANMQARMLEGYR